MRRYSRLAKPPCRTRFFACSNPFTSFFKTEKAVINTAFSVLMVGATRFEHATSWSQTKRSTRLSYTPSTETIFTPYFLICKHYFLCGDFLCFSLFSSIIRPSSPRIFLGVIKPCARKLYTPSFATIK